MALNGFGNSVTIISPNRLWRGRGKAVICIPNTSENFNARRPNNENDFEIHSKDEIV